VAKSNFFLSLSWYNYTRFSCEVSVWCIN